MSVSQKIIVGALTGVLWLVAIAMKHFWPDVDIQMFQYACVSVLGMLGIHTTAAAFSGNKQGGFVSPRMSVALIGLALGLAMLSGCAAGVPITSQNNPIGAFTLQDAQGASKLAQQRGDATGQKCYDYIASAIEATAAVPFMPGLLYLNEVRRTAASATQGLAAACGGVLPIVVGL